MPLSHLTIDSKMRAIVYSQHQMRKLIAHEISRCLAAYSKDHCSRFLTTRCLPLPAQTSAPSLRIGLSAWRSSPSNLPQQIPSALVHDEQPRPPRSGRRVHLVVAIERTPFHLRLAMASWSGKWNTLLRESPNERDTSFCQGGRSQSSNRPGSYRCFWRLAADATAKPRMTG